ncbi:hypothetical protein PBRA_004079 [Plasmodiophora brassicae]|uniref:RGS domain-containing protein n=1 Tax=Plasmodiophora brassicae TaxID=37360 RepID=A0A0G4IJC9_PLABS|nr:hypothetical protein PBRA_004079 [Plasmodiophora brassicae]
MLTSIRIHRFGSNIHDVYGQLSRRSIASPYQLVRRRPLDERQVAFVAVGCIYAASTTVGIALYWRQRTMSLLISARRPGTVIMFVTAVTAIPLALCYTEVWRDTPCWLVISVVYEALTLAMDAMVFANWNYLFLWRVNQLLSDFKIDAERSRSSVDYNKRLSQPGVQLTQVGPSASSTYSANALFISRSCFTNSAKAEIAFFVIGQMTTSVPVIVYLTVSNDPDPTLPFPDCLSSPTATTALCLFVARTCICVLEISSLMFMVRDAEDHLGICRSWRRCLVTIVVCAIVTVVMVTTTRAAALGVEATVILTTLAISGELLIRPVYEQMHERGMDDTTETSAATSQAAFERFLQTSDGYNAVLRFAASEFSAENVVFWAEVTKFESSWDRRNDASRQAMAARIRSSFLSGQAHHLVNVSTVIWTSGEQRPLGQHMFKEEKDEVLQLMYGDTFRRFLTNPAYQAVWDRFLHRQHEKGMLLSRVSSSFTKPDSAV